MSNEGKANRGRPTKNSTICRIATEDGKQTILTSKSVHVGSKEHAGEQSPAPALFKMIEKIDSLADEFKKIKKEICEVRKEHTEIFNIFKEIANLKEDLKQKENKGAEEKKILEIRIDQLEEIEEMKQRKKNKNNIIIKGLNIKAEIKEIRQFLHEKLKIEINDKIEAVQEIKTANFKMFKVRLSDWNTKQKIKENKKLLKGEKIFKDDDLTSEQRKIQTEIRKYANEQRDLGKKVKVGYQKI